MNSVQEKNKMIYQFTEKNHTNKEKKMNPLSTRRYTDLVDRLNSTVVLLHKFLELKIEEMEQKNKEEKKKLTRRK